MAMYRNDFERQAQAESLPASSTEWQPVPGTHRLPMANAS